MNRKRILLFVLFGAGVLALVIFFALPASQPPPVPLPDPNGYDIFVKSGRMLADDLSEFGKMSREELRAGLLKNAEGLKLARTGLALDCRVPPDYSPTNMARINDLAVIKRLGVGLAAEGKLAELENRPDDAAAAYLDLIRLGHESGRGGVMIDALVGIAVEAIGTAQLETLAANLDARQCREAARMLEAAEARRESAATVLQQEKTWARRAFGFKGEITRLFTIKSDQQMEQRFIAKCRTQQTRAKTLMIRLAARAFELEHGARPKALADLVPDILKTIPQDPATGSNMVFTP